MMLERKIEIYGSSKEEFAGKTVAEILHHLFMEEEWSLAKLCREFESSRPAMAACLRRNGLDLKFAKQTKVEYMLEKHGYSDIGEFFQKHWNLTYAQMADILGVFPRTISREYKKYKASLEGTSTNEGASATA